MSVEKQTLVDVEDGETESEKAVSAIIYGRIANCDWCGVPCPDHGAEILRELGAGRDGLLKQVSELRAALNDIASQRLRSEIKPIDGEISGDFEFAYDQMIGVARAALKE